MPRHNVLSEGTDYLYTHTCTDACDHGSELRDQITLDTVLDYDTGALAEDFNLDNFGGFGFGYRGKLIADLDQVVDQIFSGNSHNITGSNRITYTFLQNDNLVGLYNSPQYNFGANNGAAPFTAAQQDAARASIALWDDLISPEFVESNGRGADIQFANSWDPAQAYAYYPEYGFTNARGYNFFGDVFVADPRSYFDADGTLLHEGNYSNGDLSFGGYGATTLTHEIGHAIGLSHPGAYNGAGATTYLDQAEYAQDSEQYSIMSYWGASETGARIVDWGTFFFSNPQTPLLHDVYTIQQVYGADPTTRADDTTYGFNSTADRAVFDFTQNEHPYLTIYDAGGIDTIDLSGFEASVLIDLRDGQFSSAGQGNITTADQAEALQSLNDAIEVAYGIEDYYAPADQATIDSVTSRYMGLNASDIAADTGHAGVEAMQYQNISIAYGTEIENAVGTDYRDVIITNEQDNVLTGNGGADVFVFASDERLFTDSFTNGGTDIITDFEEGVDTVDLSGLGITEASTLTAIDNRLEIDIDSDGVIDQTIIFENLDAIPVGDILFG
ncbi:M10 family metallopeptidase C-terminal domain-containing protein [Qipengyuania sp. XHP0211]|uniref:M10 family metallopeptidase C-terminal domain-containing protein n=1 Tax=Qipengyuania sp. XHP0211 TaxID=3038079 RepID=UPI00241FB3D7|nr:M10 family metallopeptidase C-terminal domain-containing protein [Qipengyuania sp. XHP0211]MDG5751150.1 M10 family metallopeptidase C-terminal domain-containing protein [Qipengyuania sp. XHP0211]